MLSIVRRMLKLAGEYAPRLKIAFFISILEGFFIKAPMILVLYILIKMVSHTVAIKDAWIIGILGILSIILRGISKRLVEHFQSATGYEILARERMKLGDRLKRLPMGYFTEGNIGNITSVITSDLVFIEEHSMSVLSKVITGYINTIMGIVMMIVIDYRVGIISIITIIMAILVFKTIHKVEKYHSTLRQENQSRLTSVVLEYIKGITVFKAFNMVGDRANMVNDEFRRYRDTSIDFEKKLIPIVIRYESCFTLGISLTVLAATYFTFNKTLDISFMLVILIFIFELYLPFKALGPLSAQLRIMEVGLNRYDAINNIDIIDEDGKDTVLENFDIEFRDVNFSYERDEVIRNISFKVPEYSMTALVGKSGCGKTTIANLIARFWDIQKGEVKIGGVNVKEMTCDSLLKNISMVFQNVYLFQDTVLNNIKFGKSDATMEEVIEAAKKARCHEFIMNLKNGYDTVIGEGGSTLSGGEKQRISIARAILKDAPIILLDEATASVDPDNEKHIQMAINELVKDKTLIVIAHRLSTVKNADQILVIDDGKIIQSGTHNELIKQKGQYNSFWQRRMKARSWEISTSYE